MSYKSKETYQRHYASLNPKRDREEDKRTIAKLLSQGLNRTQIRSRMGASWKYVRTIIDELET